VSHPLPLHPADRLERVLDDMRQSVASSGDEGWLMRIVAMVICRFLDQILEMLVGVLAEIRAGTIVLPDWAYDSPITASRPLPVDGAAPSQRSRATGANTPSTAPACAAEPRAPETAALVARRVEYIASSSRLRIRRPAHGPGGHAFHPSAVPRGPIRESRFGASAPTHA
jgi:hypothetical protein